MTIIVGVVGVDGILLAADKRMWQAGEDISEIHKIKFLPEHGVAYAGAGDLIPWRAGRVLSRALDNHQFDFRRIGESLEDIGAAAFKEHRAEIEETHPDIEQQKMLLGPLGEDTGRGLLIVFYGRDVAAPQLWGLGLLPGQCFANQIDGMVVYGASSNKARFFQKYFLPKMPISKLHLLAAHTVLMANHFDNLMIAGLHIASFTKTSSVLLDVDETEKLAMRSKELDQSICDQLYAEVAA